MQRLDLIPLTTVVIIMAELWTDDLDALRPTTNGRKMRVKDSGGTRTVEVDHTGVKGRVICNNGDLELTDGAGKTITVRQIVDNKSNVGHTHVKADITDLGSPLYSVSQDAAPALGGELNAGARSIGFDLNTTLSSQTNIDWTKGNKAARTLTANTIFTFTNPTKPCSLILKIIQDATGGRTVTWPAAVKWPSGTAPVLTTAPNAVDIVALFFDGTNYYGVASLNFS